MNLSCPAQVDYALARVPGAEENESSWVFATAFAKRDAGAAAALVAFCEDAKRDGGWGASCACLHAALVDLYGRDDATKPQAAACARALASELDVTRAKFWTHKAEALTA